MKTYSRIILAAFAAAFGLASCAHEELAPAEKPQGKLVTVHFGAESQIATAKATLTTEDEKTFKSAWENGDVLSVEYVNTNETDCNGVVDALWKSESSSFDATLPEYTGMWEYRAVYPKPDAEGAVDFGSSRTQKGNTYNSAYDLMYGGAEAENAPAGKTDDGKDIVFNMNRQTAIAYFHLTGTLNEDVVSAKLSVEGDIACLATSSAKLEDYSKGYKFDDGEDNALKEITITFEDGTAPKASDFCLWFNVLPTIYSKMTLTVETSGHTLTISKTAKDEDDGTYEAGKLYKVVKEIPVEKWMAKSMPAPESSYTIEFNSFTKGETSPATTTKATTLITSGSEYVASQPFSEISSCFYGGDSTNGKPLRVGTSSKAGSITLALSDLGKVDATKIVLSAKQFSSGKSKSIGVNGSAKLKPADDYTDLSFELNGEKLTSIKLDSDGYIYVKSITVIAGIPKTALEAPANLSVSETKTVSWDAVSGAASYNVTIGTQTFSAETNSYDASAVEDEYYDVAVVAVPSDTENYKNSAAATLTAAKFGTPTLAAPELKEGLIDESSVNVTWTADSRAASGYKCEIYQGEALVATKTVTENSVEFTELTAETEYVVKVNAVAVEGEKPYAASEVASITLTTKAAGTASNDGSLEHPYTAAEAIAVIDGGKGLADKYVKGVVKKVTSFNTTYSSLTYDIESGDATLNIYGGLDLGNAGFAGTDDLKAGDEVVVFGTLMKYKSTYEMAENNYLISVNGETEIYRGLSVSGQKSAFTVGDAFEFGGKVLQVWRGKDDIDVTASASFSGYDMSTEGKQTVTVTVGSETITYEITVNPAGTVIEYNETIDLSKGTYSSSAGNITWYGTSCSFVQSKASSSSSDVNKSYLSAPRWYKGHKVSFTANNGYAITKVVVTCTSNDYATALGNSTYSDGASSSVSQSVVTITTSGNFDVALGAQSRITSVQVYYTK